MTGASHTFNLIMQLSNTENDTESVAGDSKSQGVMGTTDSLHQKREMIVIFFFLTTKYYCRDLSFPIHFESAMLMNCINCRMSSKEF